MMWLYKQPIAHRGLHNSTASENSVSAFKNAIDQNFNIEIDVHLLKDGKLAVFHDFNLIRMTGQDIDIELLTSADLERDIYKLPNGEKIPLYEDVLNLIHGKVGLLVELKSKSWKDFTLEKNFVQLSEDFVDEIAVQAFNPLSVKWLMKHARHFNIGQLATRPYKFLVPLFMFIGPIASARRLKTDFLSFNILGLPYKRVTKAVAKTGMKLISWTIRTEQDEEKAHKLGLDNIIFENITPKYYK